MLSRGVKHLVGLDNENPLWDVFLLFVAFQFEGSLLILASKA